MTLEVIDENESKQLIYRARGENGVWNFERCQISSDKTLTSKTSFEYFTLKFLNILELVVRDILRKIQDKQCIKFLPGN